MQSQIAHHEEILKRDRKPNDIIERAVGVRKQGKKKTREIISAAFAGHHKAKAFGIYDSEHADPRLPKQAIDEMCRNWLEGAQWTLRYYSSGMDHVNNNWFYKFSESPPINDLLTYIEERITVTVPGIPGALTYIDGDDMFELEKINISDGVIYVYLDNEQNKVALLRTIAGKEMFINIDKIKFLRENPSQAESQLIEDSGLFPLVETSRRMIKLKVQKRFTHDDEIYASISRNNTNPATIVESFFSIMPRRILEPVQMPREEGIIDGVKIPRLEYIPSILTNFLHPAITATVLGMISDAFPEKFQISEDGTFYDSQAMPKIPFLSPSRLRRALDSVDDKFRDIIIGMNTIHPRYKILHKQSDGVVKLKELKRVFTRK